MKSVRTGRWNAALGLSLACAAWAQSAAQVPSASAPVLGPSAPSGKASAPVAKAASKPAAKASAPAAKPPAAAAKSLKVQVMFADSATQGPKPVAGAVVRLQGSEQTFATNALGVAEVFGTLEGKPQLTVIVVNASICNLPIRAGGGNLTVVVPKRGQGACRIGP